MTFYETHIFTDQIVDLIDDDSYAELQATLIVDPEAGDLMPRSRGLRKIRWKAQGRGKRGGIRIIYYLIHRQKYLCFTLTRRTRERISQQIKFGGLETLLTSI
jgi:mRNA-degrading endonuclease RelE of RelBE toxin-antitoxin system